MPIMTRSEAEIKAGKILNALKDMPLDSPERVGYLDSVEALNKEYGLGMEELITALETESSVQTEEEDPKREKLVLPEEKSEEKVELDPSVKKNESKKSKEGDDDEMAKAEKTDYVAKAKAFLNTHLFGGVRVSHVVAAILAALVVIVASSLLSSDDSDLQKQINNLNTEKGWINDNLTLALADVKAFQTNQTGRDCGDKKYNDTELEAALAEVQSDLDDCQNETGASAEIGTFDEDETKDWIDGKLFLKDTAVKSFVPFESEDEALEFVRELYPYNTAHNLKWNNEEANFAIADEHKSERDEVKMLFSSKNNDLFAVIPSDSNIVIPTIYKFVEEDNDWALEEYDGDAAVVAMDKLKKSSSSD